MSLTINHMCPIRGFPRLHPYLRTVVILVYTNKLGPDLASYISLNLYNVCDNNTTTLIHALSNTIQILFKAGELPLHVL